MYIIVNYEYDSVKAYEDDIFDFCDPKFCWGVCGVCSTDIYKLLEYAMTAAREEKNSCSGNPQTKIVRADGDTVFYDHVVLYSDEYVSVYVIRKLEVI